MEEPRWAVRIAQFEVNTLTPDFPYFEDFDQKINPLGWLEVFDKGFDEPMQLLEETGQLSIEFNV